jgi:rare lipoprotein A
MFIDTRIRHAVKAATVCAALCSVTIQTGAAALIGVPHLPNPIVVAAAFSPLDRAASVPAPVSFGERFTGLRSAAIDTILSSPAIKASLAPRPVHYEPGGEAIVGAASTYDPTNPADRDAGSMQTSSGEAYDRDGWTAAIQIDLRWQFGGVRYGRNYVPTYALVECNGLRAIVKINDVGPLRPGRIIDLNTRTMRFFDPTMKIGVLDDVKVTPLAGTDVAVGPVEGWTAMAGDYKPVWE